MSDIILVGGGHTMQYKAGVFSGIWSDMAIETSYMRFGHGSMGIIGQAMKPETMKIWAYSVHSCYQVFECLDFRQGK